MKIFFRTKKLQRICSDQAYMLKHLGEQATKLQQRLMELYAAESLADISYLPPARRHKYSGDRKGQFSVDLVHPFRLLFIPANDPLPIYEDGGIDLARVTEIEIIGILDPH